jgi:hypothetical protein
MEAFADEQPSLVLFVLRGATASRQRALGSGRKQERRASSRSSGTSHLVVLCAVCN